METKFVLGGANRSGGFQVILCREAEEGLKGTYKVKGGGAIFMGELTTQVFYQNYVPMSSFFGVNRVL